jgi:hypothetical protein
VAKLNKNQRLLLIGILIASIALSSIGITWFLEGDIHYSQSIAVYEKEGDQWVTRHDGERENGAFTQIACGNYGFWESSFSLVLTFTNATFSAETSQPYQKISDTVVKFSYTLQKDEWAYTDVYFTIGEKIISFSLKLELEPAQPFIRSTNLNGQTAVDYNWDPQENAFLPNTIG